MMELQLAVLCTMAMEFIGLDEFASLASLRCSAPASELSTKLRSQRDAVAG